MYKSVMIAGAIIIVCLVLFFSYSYIRDHPAEPVAGGDFPSQPVWIFEASERITSSPVSSNGQIFFRTKNWIYAVDASTGVKIWRSASLNKSTPSLAPLIAKDRLIISEEYSNIGVYSIETGYRLWSTNTYLEGIQDPTRIESMVNDSNTVFVARESHKLTAYSLSKGTILWSVWVPSRTGLYLAVGPQIIYLAAHDILRAYDSTSGKMLWEKTFDTLVGPIAFDNNTLYVAVNFGHISLIAFEPITMSEIWAIPSQASGIYDPVIIAMDKQYVFLGSKHLAAISKETGQILWNTQFTYWLEQPVILGDQIYVRNIGTTLFGFSLRNGQEQSRLTIQANYAMGNAPDRSPIAADNFLIVPFGDHRLMAYDP